MTDYYPHILKQIVALCFAVSFLVLLVTPLAIVILLGLILFSAYRCADKVMWVLYGWRERE